MPLINGPAKSHANYKCLEILRLGQGSSLTPPFPPPLPALLSCSYRRFCRLDDVSAHYWSEPWLASVNSLDNPAFSNSEELLHLQALEPTCCGCREGCLAADGHHRKPLEGAPCRGGAGRPR